MRKTEIFPINSRILLLKALYYCYGFGIRVNRCQVYAYPQTDTGVNFNVDIDFKMIVTAVRASIGSFGACMYQRTLRRVEYLPLCALR